GVSAGRVGGPVGHAAIPETLLRAAGGPGTGDATVDLRTSPGGGTVSGGLPPSLAYRVLDGYKLVLSRTDGRPRLFDLRADPAEREDLAARYPQRVATLARGLDQPGQVQPVPADLR